MKITTATLIALLALGSTFTFAQNANTAPAKVETPEIYTVTVTTVMRPILPNGEAQTESADSQVSRSEDITVNIKLTAGGQDLQTLPLEKSNALDVVAAR